MVKPRYILAFDGPATGAATEKVRWQMPLTSNWEDVILVSVLAIIMLLVEKVKSVIRLFVYSTNQRKCKK